MTEPSGTNSPDPNLPDAAAGGGQQYEQEWLGEGQVSPMDVQRATNSVAGAVMTLGIVTGVFGLVMLLWPGATLRVVAVLFGIWLVLSGLVLLAQTFASQLPGGMRLLAGLGGVLSVIIGAVAIFNGDASVKILVIFVLIGWLANGLANIIVGIRDKFSPNRGAYLFIGIVQIALAILVIAWPSATVTTLVRVIGIGLLITAALEIWAATRIRKYGSQSDVVLIKP